ncbi:MAG: hypothetical protein WBZ36_18115 [Candidatus Nitrosopolaris sp.]
MKTRIIFMIGTLGFLLTAGVLATLNSQQVFAKSGGGAGSGSGGGSGSGSGGSGGMGGTGGTGPGGMDGTGGTGPGGMGGTGGTGPGGTRSAGAQGGSDQYFPNDHNGNYGQNGYIGHNGYNGYNGIGGQWMGHPWNWWHGHGHWGAGTTVALAGGGIPGMVIPIGGGPEIIGGAGYPTGAPTLIRSDPATIR